MLEGLAAWILRTYVGEYVENLNTDQLSIGYGGIELENLTLKKTALQGFELPLVVRAGFIGRLKLEIPFSRPKSQPWIICIDKLFIIAGPPLSSEYDADAKAKHEQHKKQQLLDALESQWKASREKQGGQWSESWWPSLYSSFSTTVAENLQLVITDVHFRYEDASLNLEKPFAFGVTIEKLAARSTDDKWEAKFLHSDDEMKFKLIELTGLAIYWDSEVKIVGNLSAKSLEKALHRSVKKESGSESLQDHSYVLEPVSGQARMTRNSSKSPLLAKDGPRFDVEFLLDKIPLSLSDVQYSGFLMLLDEMQRHFKAQKYQMLRPKTSIRECSADWWKFAINCHMEPIREKNKRHSKAFLVQRVADILVYVKAYTEHLTNPAIGPETVVVRKVIEEKLSLDEIRIIRSIVTSKITREESLRKAADRTTKLEQEADKNGASWGSWLTGWTSWYGYEGENPDQNNGESGTSAKVTFKEPVSKEEEEFLGELAEAGCDDSIFKRDHVFVKLNFKLNSGMLRIKTTTLDKGCVPVAELEFSKVQWISDLRPKTNSWQFSTALGALFLRDLCHKETLFPILIRAQDQKNIAAQRISQKAQSGVLSSGLAALIDDDVPPLLEISFEQRPLGLRGLNKLSVKLQPLTVVYNSDVMARLSEFFKPSRQSKYRLKVSNIESQLQKMALDRYREFKNLTKTEFRHAVDDLMTGESKKENDRWDVQLDISAPIIILPEGFSGKDTSMVIIDLGRISFVNAPALQRQRSESLGHNSVHTESGDEDEFLTPYSTPPDDEDFERMINEAAFSQELEDMEALKERFYERYNLEFANLQVVVCKTTDDWSKITMKKTSPFHIVDSFTISLQMERRQAFTSDPNWPAVTFSGSLPQLMVHIDEKKIQVLFKCIQQLQEEKRPIPHTESSASKMSLSDASQIPAKRMKLTDEGTIEARKREELSTPHRELSVLHNRARELLVESCLALANFRFDQVSLRLHSRGRCIAELQISGVEAEYTKRPYDFSVSFVLHSLLVIDALQTFGPEYKHLVSSHRSGYVAEKHQIKPENHSRSLYDESSDALIRINYQQIDSDFMPSEDKENRPERIASLNFSSLDIIANQETIVELMNVIDAIQWKSPQTNRVKEFSSEESMLSRTENENALDGADEQILEDKKMQVDLSMQRVNITLARGVSTQDQGRHARKVSAITIADLEFSADIGIDQTVKGSLGGLEILDLTPGNILHKVVLGIGECQSSAQSTDASSIDSENKAFSFTFSKLAATDAGSITTDIHIASARYIHSSDFLTELSLCAGDFRDYAASVARSLQTAAADAAKGFVSAKKEAAEASFSYADDLPMHIDDPSITDGSKPDNRIIIRLCIETPVIIMPKGLNSPELLVGNLGQISVRNSYIQEPNFREESMTANIDRIFIDINNVSMYSVVLGSSQIRELQENSRTTFDFLKQRPVSSLDIPCSPIRGFHWPRNEDRELETLNEASAESSVNEQDDFIKCVQILHDTGLQLVIDRCICDSSVCISQSKNIAREPSFQVEGVIDKPLKLALSTNTYNQVLETLNTLSPGSKQGSSCQLDQNEAVTKAGNAKGLGSIQRSLSSHQEKLAAPRLPKQDEIDESSDDIMFEAGDRVDDSVDDSDSVDISHTQISVNFEISELDVVFGAEIRGVEREFANLRLQEFILSYSNISKPFSEISINLGGLHVEDLLHDGDPAYRYLMKSSESENRLGKQNLSFTSRLSTSCPEGSSFLDYRDLSSSLPTILTYSPKRQTPQVMTQLRPMMLNQRKFPSQPQLSVTRESFSEDEYEVEHLLAKGREDSWVKVKITLVDDDDYQNGDSSETFVNKHIDVAFNSLDLTVNLQTWVVIFEFFGIGAPPSQLGASGQTSPSKSLDLSRDIEDPSQIENFPFEETNFTGTDVRVSLKSLSATLNKEKYPLAKAVVSSLSFDVELRGSDQKVTGSIGNMSLSDMSPYGSLYRERFVTYGNQAVAFTFFRYGEPDPFLKRDLDMKLELKMSSVQYVHTQRFLSEVIAFAQHFLQLQEVLGRMRAASEGNEVFAVTNRAARISLSIDADVPILILPRSAASHDMLVACLGHIVVANSFQYAGSPDTVSGKFTATRFRNNQNEASVDKKAQGLGCQTSVSDCDDRLLDCMNIGLVDMEVFTALRTDESTHHNMSFGYERQGGKLMRETCRIELIVERNLEWAFGRQVPDMTIAGNLSSIYVTLDLAQFGLIMGMLGENLGEPCEQFERPSSVLIDPLQEKNESDAMWTTLSMSLSLVNVTVEMIPRFSFGQIPSKQNAPEQLGKLDFIQSKFVFESFSDGSRSMDLVSHGVLLHDIRGLDSKSGNVFTKILAPTEKYSDPAYGKALQFEVHYLDTKDKSHVTCLFNRSHIVVIVDFLMETWKFITRKEENEFNERNGEQMSPPKEELLSPSSADVHLPSGVMTKAASAASKKPEAKTFELKVNMTDTEIIVVEDYSSKDTAAVILQTTAVLAYRPNHFSERPLTISLQSLEVFSCVLASIDETALSIIDPVTVLIELNSAAKLKSHTLTKGLLGAVQRHPSLEVHFHSQLSLRLSYHDIKLFLRIFESAKKQIDFAMEKPQSDATNGDQRPQEIEKTSEERMIIVQKPIITDDSPQLDGMPVNSNDLHPVVDGSENQGMTLAAVEVTGTSLCFCLIDDCGNNDIPLIEILLNNLYLWHDLEHTGEGTSHATVLADYYNRNVSGWEPCIEPWKCTFHWQKTPKTDKKGERTLVKLHAPERLDLNITPALLEMINTTKSSWTEDYLKDNSSSQSEDSSLEANDKQPSITKKRAPFVPFLLRNKTGCTLWFGTLTTSPVKAVGNTDSNLLDGRKSSMYDSIASWKEVKSDNEIPISFESRDKMRHKGTHKLKVHQIVVQSDGWQPTTPVTVDRVGDFFRHVAPSQEKTGPMHLLKLQTVRLVFSVTLEGARKVVTVRSSLVISNKTNVPVEVWAENVSENTGLTLPILVPGASLPVPVSVVQWSLYVRPKIPGSYDFCKDSLEWRDVTKPHEGRGHVRECQGKQKHDLFRFCCFVMREGFPVDKPANFIETVEKKVFVHPAHVISLVHHLLLVNLLPVELSYIIKGSSTRERIKPGKSTPLHDVDSTNTFEIGFSFECHPRFEYVRISTRYRMEPAIIPIKLQDFEGRPIILNLKIEHEFSTVKISVFSPYWLVNKTGIPLIFRREGESFEASGQFEDHEKARSLTPLLFSYIEEESMFRCQMRVGKFLYPDQTCLPLWGNSFSLEVLRDHRTLYVRQESNKPEITFDIGIDSYIGKGQLSCTRIVSFVTKYQLENRSRHTLAFAQRHIVKGQGTTTPNGCLVSLPDAITLFHWPRSDFDPLLCVRLHHVNYCHWSGGFKIDREGSFHINMRSSQNCSFIFLRVEVILEGATYHVILTDTEDLPPPFRIDNMSQVEVMFWQEKCVDSTTRSILKSKHSIPYALHEPSLQAKLTLSVFEEMSETYDMMVLSDDSPRLYYQNAIFIVFGKTFNPYQCITDDCCHGNFVSLGSKFEDRNLVLDVVDGHKVVLSKKILHKRSQLWRMNAKRQLLHVGSSSPLDPRKKSPKGKPGLVLDLLSSYNEKRGFAPLVLARSDPQREVTQTWSFEDGLLKCGLPNMAVRPQDGVNGLREGCAAVIAPLRRQTSSKLPAENCLCKHKLRPGSGALVVRITTDGPTRVIRITDACDDLVYDEEKDWTLVEKSANASQYFTLAAQTSPFDPELELNISLAQGFGISMINSIPEEIVFATFSRIQFNYLSRNKNNSLEFIVGTVQVDNQLFGSSYPVLLFPTPLSSKPESTKEEPAIELSICRERSSFFNLDIYRKFDFNVRKMTALLEDRTLLKLLQFFGSGEGESEDLKSEDFDIHNSQKILDTHNQRNNGRKLYFERVILGKSEAKLSLLTVGRLTPDLLKIKRSLGIPIVSLEDAVIELSCFRREHLFETTSVIFQQLKRHYSDVVRGQAANVLGSLDILGNPMGLLHDVSTGMEALVKRGNLGGLIVNVAHGLSDTAAKMTGSIADGLWSASMDSRLQESRGWMRADRGSSSGDHLLAGFKGLGMGVIGGLTSMVTQPIEGANRKGIQGFFTGIGKGIVGTVAKPAAGVLDLASGAAAAVRGSARGKQYAPKPVRLKRNCYDAGGVLPVYSRNMAEGQDVLLKLNEYDVTEWFVASELVRSDKDDRMRSIITTDRVYFVRAKGPPSPDAVVLHLDYYELFDARPLSEGGRNYLELIMCRERSGDSLPSRNPDKRPRVRCDSTFIARKVSDKINYMKSLYAEKQLTVIKETIDPT